MSREQIAELLEQVKSDDPEARLAATELLCPCHVRTRIPEVWAAIYRLMEDADPRVRRAAWHTIEDGGKPGDPEVIGYLRGLLEKESDPKVRKFAEWTWKKAFGTQLEDEERARLWAAGRERKTRGKCDFCGESGVFVERDLQAMIPTDGLPRAAWICEMCRV